MTGQRDPRDRLSFERNASTYDAGRPGYPVAVYDALERFGALTPTSQVLEIGPGSGQATGELLARGERVDVVELGPGLAVLMRARLPSKRLRIWIGDIHTIELPDQAYDLVASATTFHWLRVPEVLPRLSAALRPGGWLAVWWTAFGYPISENPVQPQIDRILARIGESPGWVDGVPRPLRAAERIAELEHEGWFELMHHEQIRWSIPMDGPRLAALFGTFPNVANLEPKERSATLAAFESAVDGGVPYPFTTALYLLRRG